MLDDLIGSSRPHHASCGWQPAKPISLSRTAGQAREGTRVLLGTDGDRMLACCRQELKGRPIVREQRFLA
jgi:hypothetical protein